MQAGARLGVYELVEELGAGGMGVVWRAHDRRLGRDVALKILPPHLAAHPDALVRFEREARGLAALSHPNIVSIFDLGDEGGLRYIVTEVLAGETLRETLRRGPLPWRRAAEICATIADGLAAAHAKGILHRDLKPENIFLTTDERVKILDFGLATVVALPNANATTVAHQTEPGRILGTLGYTSPEQLRGEEMDFASDIFALGCVLFELMSGRPAFFRNSSAETIAAILTEEPPALDATPGVPPEVARIVKRCLEKRRGARFQSASDLAFALRHLSLSSQRVEVEQAAPRRRGVVAAMAIGRRLRGIALPPAGAVAERAGRVAESTGERGPHAARLRRRQHGFRGDRRRRERPRGLEPHVHGRSRRDRAARGRGRGVVSARRRAAARVDRRSRCVSRISEGTAPLEQVHHRRIRAGHRALPEIDRSRSDLRAGVRRSGRYARHAGLPRHPAGRVAAEGPRRGPARHRARPATRRGVHVARHGAAAVRLGLAWRGAGAAPRRGAQPALRDRPSCVGHLPRPGRPRRRGAARDGDRHRPRSAVAGALHRPGLGALRPQRRGQGHRSQRARHPPRPPLAAGARGDGLVPRPRRPLRTSHRHVRVVAATEERRHHSRDTLRDAFRTGGATAYLREKLAQAANDADTTRAAIHVRLGEHERALDALEAGFRKHERDMIYIKSSPTYAALRGHPRFEKLIAAIGFPPR